MNAKLVLWGIVGLGCLCAQVNAGIFGFHGCGHNNNTCTTTITMRPYNAFSPVCSGSLVCDGCCPFPMGGHGGGHHGGGHGGGHGHHLGLFGHHGNPCCPPPMPWSPCCPIPHYNANGLAPACGDCNCSPCTSCTSHYLPPASYYPYTSYYPPLPVPINGPAKGHRPGHGGPPPQGGGHTSHYGGYYPQPQPQPYYWPTAYPGYWYPPRY